MDLPSEIIQSAKETYLNANTNDFLYWIKENVGIEIDFPTDDITQYLKEIHWESYINDLEYADKAKFKMVSY